MAYTKAYDLLKIRERIEALKVGESYTFRIQHAKMTYTKTENGYTVNTVCTIEHNMINVSLGVQDD